MSDEQHREWYKEELKKSRNEPKKIKTEWKRERRLRRNRQGKVDGLHKRIQDQAIEFEREQLEERQQKIEGMK